MKNKNWWSMKIYYDVSFALLLINLFPLVLNDMGAERILFIIGGGVLIIYLLSKDILFSVFCVSKVTKFILIGSYAFTSVLCYLVGFNKYWFVVCFLCEYIISYFSIFYTCKKKGILEDDAL